jgi:PAS domain S-box-containing protein
MENTSNHSEENPIIHPQDFTEWNPNPIIEINVKGEIICFNLAARAQFPNLLSKGAKHPLLSGLIGQIESLVKTKGEFVVFLREVKYLNRIYEQQLFSVAEKTSIYIYMNDITSHKHIEKQLTKKNIEHTETTILLNNILESSIEYSIIATNLKGDILVWNEGAHRSYGYTTNEIVGKKNIKISFLPEDIQSERIKKFFDIALQQEKTEEVFELIRKNGSHFFGSVVLTLRRDDAGSPIGYVLISKDITKQKQLEEQLLKNNQELEQFAYITSHDLKAPLRAIERLVSWIEEDNADKLDDKSKENLGLLRQRVVRMSNLIAGILQYSRVGRVDFNIDSVDTNQLLREVIDSLDLSKKFTIHVADNFPVLQTDKIILGQVFSNLISNSIKHHHQEKGHIEIGVKDAEYFYEFSVKDDGPGIEPEYHEKIFQIFQTLKSKDELESTGIGLSIVKKIIESQGGKIIVDSIKDQGTTFRFTWPKRVIQEIQASANKNLK